LTDLLPSSKQLAWLLVRDPDLLTTEEEAVLQHVCQDEQVGQLHRLARQFVSMVKQRLADQLDPWLEACETFSAVQIQNFASSLRQDYAAVRAALDMPWSQLRVTAPEGALLFWIHIKCGRTNRIGASSGQHTQIGRGNVHIIL
jgi:transposase